MILKDLGKIIIKLQKDFKKLDLEELIDDINVIRNDIEDMDEKDDNNGFSGLEPELISFLKSMDIFIDELEDLEEKIKDTIHNNQNIDDILSDVKNFG